MTTSLTTEIHPLLASLAQLVSIRNETKVAIVEIDAGIADAQQQIEKHQHRVASAQQDTSNTRIFYANTFQQGNADLLACHQMTKQLLEAHLQTVS